MKSITENRKVIVFFIALLMSDSVAAQRDSIKRHDHYVFIDGYYGYRSYSQNFYNQLNTLGTIKLERPLQVIGAGTGFHVDYASSIGGFGGFEHIAFYQILPQKIYIQDTLKGKITGGVFSFDFGKGIKSKFATFDYYIGFNTGRLRIYDNELIRQKNLFFSPKIGIRPRIKRSRFAIVAILEYEYDISKTKWSRTLFATTDKVAITGLRQSGLTVQVGMGYAID
jgi:hypothetical protein